MTTLEIILTIIIWIGYGCFDFNQFIKDSHSDDGIVGGFIFTIMIAPVILIIRMIWGIFTSKFH
jgi:hypothetical protein